MKVINNLSLLANNLSSIGVILARYEIDLSKSEEDLKIEGKTLEDANKENPSLMAYYDERRVELKSVLKFMETEIARVRSKLFRSFSEGYDVALAERAKEKYIDGEPEYLMRRQIYLEIEEMYEKYTTLVKAFELRGYALRNITEIRVASLENVLL